jgi:N-acetylglucosamine-6-phosphate deacetylase
MLRNAKIYTGLSHNGEILCDQSIFIEGDKISRLVHNSALAPYREKLKKCENDHDHDLRGMNIAPGFIDLQVNGGGGSMFTSDTSVKSIRRIVNAHSKRGTTNMLLSLISPDNATIAEAVKATKEYALSYGNSVLGIHLEGPFITLEKRGIHPKENIRSMNDEDLKIILDAKETIRIVTVSPESVSNEQIKSLKDAGIVVSIGHSNATYCKAFESFIHGVSCATHLYNAMSGISAREPGVIGAVLDCNKDASIIVDGIHVSYPLVRMAKKILRDKLFLVSDAMPVVGGKTMSFKIGTEEVIYDLAGCETKEGVIGGSAISMRDAVKGCIEKAGMETAEAIRMATSYPARVLGEGTIGVIREGSIANMVIFDDSFNIKAVVLSGVYRKI